MEFPSTEEIAFAHDNAQVEGQSSSESPRDDVLLDAYSRAVIEAAEK